MKKKTTSKKGKVKKVETTKVEKTCKCKPISILEKTRLFIDSLVSKIKSVL